MINWIGLAASIAGVILLMFCDSLLALRQQRRLGAMQAQLDNLTSAIRSLEAARIDLLVRPMNLPRPVKSARLSAESALHIVASKISPEYYDSCL
jgi:hypothetical protein